MTALVHYKERGNGNDWQSQLVLPDIFFEEKISFIIFASSCSAYIGSVHQDYSGWNLFSSKHMIVTVKYLVALPTGISRPFPRVLQRTLNKFTGARASITR